MVKGLHDKTVKPAEFKGVPQDILTPLPSQETLKAFQDFNLCYGESYSV